MTEDELQENVRDVCKKLGLTVQHIHDSRRCWLPGWPDLWIAGPGGFLYRELKDRDGRVSPDQRRVGSKIQAAGGNWAVWRPVDWHNGVIENQLLAIRRATVCAS